MSDHLTERLNRILPKLISDELRVEDVERFVDGAGSMDEVDSGRA